MTYRIPRYSKKRLKAIEDGELSRGRATRHSQGRARSGELQARIGATRNGEGHAGDSKATRLASVGRVSNVPKGVRAA